MRPNRYTVEVDNVNAGEWAALMDQFDDATIYQTWAYGQETSGASRLSHVLLRDRGELVAMAQLRVLQPRPFRVGMAHLRWGPLCQPRGKETNPDILREMAGVLSDEYVRRRGLFLQVLPNATVGSPRAAAFASAFRGYASAPFARGSSYRTLVVNLTAPVEELRRRLDGKWRNQLNRAEKGGLSVVDEGRESDFETMTAMCRQMERRKQVQAVREMVSFGRIQRLLWPNQRMKLLLCLDRGVPVAGALASALGASGVYLMGATSDQGLSSKGSYLLQWRILNWLRDKGVREYDLGGINPDNNPGVYHFKKGLTGADVEYVKPLNACERALSRGMAWLFTAAKQALQRPCAPPSRPPGAASSTGVTPRGAPPALRAAEDVAAR